MSIRGVCSYVLLIVIGVLVGLTATTSHAAWSVIDDFEGLALGTVHNQNGWTVENNAGVPYNDADVAVDPDDASNQAMAMTKSVSRAINTDHAFGADIADGATGTLFFRFRNVNPGGALVVGAADQVTTNWSDFEGYITINGGNILLRDGGDNVDVGDYNNNEWYNAWLVLDNAADTTTLYASQTSSPGVALGTGSFRNGTTDPLNTFLIRLGNGQTGVTGYIDDIYVDNMGANLSDPTASVGTPGDFDSDGDVDGRDFLIWQRDKGDIPNLSDWEANFGATSTIAATAAVPEPASLLLASMASVAFAIWRRSPVGQRHFFGELPENKRVREWP